jgi:hypothetical protein
MCSFDSTLVFLFLFIDNMHRNQTIRHCLSDGHEWMFAVYTRDAEGNRVSYEGPLLKIDDASRTFEKDVQRLVEVLYHWVCLCLVTELVESLLTRGITSSWQTAISRVIHFAKFSLSLRCNAHSV